MQITNEKIKTQALLKKRRIYPLWVCIGLFLVLLLGVIGLAFSYSSYTMVKKTTVSATEQLAEQITDITELTVSAIQTPTYSLLDSLSKNELSKGGNLDERLRSFPFIASMLLQNPDIYSIYTGYSNGDFFYVRTLLKGFLNIELEIPPTAFFWVHSTENSPNGKKSTVTFFDKEMTFISRAEIADNLFDPRTRVWYEQALQNQRFVSTSPYHFFNSNEAGVTFSHISADGNSVVGIDMTLGLLLERLRKLLPTASSRIAMLKPDGSIVAYIRGIKSEPNKNKSALSSITLEDAPVLFRAREEYRNGKRGMTSAINIDGQEWFLFLQDLNNNYSEADNILLLAMPLNEIMDDAEALLQNTIKLALVILIMSIPIAWVMTQYAVKTLRSLAEQARQIREFRFDDDSKVVSSVKELDILGLTISKLKENITRFLSINLNISSERDFNKLLETILGEILDVANADGGAICLIDDNGNYQPEVRVHWKRPNGNIQSTILSQYPVELLPSSSDFYSGNTVHSSISRQDPLAALDILAPAFNDPEICSLNIIHIPLRNSSGHCLGSLSLFMKMESSQTSFEHQHTAFSEALASTAAIALENHRLIKAHDNLLDALVKIIAGAIDAKSPYTGGHCQRVPVIFDMLLNAACKSSEGVFKDFSITDDERKEAYLAAWLHDCGKVTTPEYVVDKATKLETIYDRIHEIRMRFEVLKRDAEIYYLRAIASEGVAEHHKQQLAEKLAEELNVLDQEFAFVANCNIGGEFLDASSVERLEQIASRSWLRTIDNSLGVSRAEGERISKTELSLPIWEPLLADKPEHIIARDNEKEEKLVVDHLGFKMKTPVDLYNRGEMHNLRISRGTLNGEERYKINEHITQTIIMLKNLPLPRNLKNIPEIAGSHHETLDGLGYPRSLTVSDLSIKSRMMAIADIFEALTACDRPYKSRKSLSEALKIMKEFRDRNHIDSELYDLFIASDIAKTYAAKYLHPDQCDI